MFTFMVWLIIFILVVGVLVYIIEASDARKSRPEEPSPAVDPTPSPIVESQPQPDLEPSCFAKGLARSLAEEQDMWEMVDLGASVGACREVLRIKHKLTGEVVYGYTYIYSLTGNFLQEKQYGLSEVRLDWVGVEGVSYIPTGECKLLMDVLSRNPIGQLAVEKARVALERDRRKRAEAYFNSLGCPIGSPTEQPNQGP